VDKYVFHPARAAAGFERPAARAINFHGLRHTFASTWLGDGVAAFIVSRLISHASVAFTLARYAHWTQDHMETARAAAVGMYTDIKPRPIMEHDWNTRRWRKSVRGVTDYFRW